MASVILSPLHPAAALLARFRRIPFPVLAAAVGLLFAVVGVAVVDDYGVSGDEYNQRRHRLCQRRLHYGRPRCSDRAGRSLKVFHIRSFLWNCL